MAQVEAERRAVLHSAQAASREQGHPLRQLQGLGSNGAWMVVRALFGWREVKKRREVGG